MKKFLVLILAVVPAMGMGQVPGYYNGTGGKNGEELKAALHEIIKDHVDFSYSDAKYILNYADSDPENESNLILFYTKRSQSSSSWGSGSDDINREHVWAKSHGDFSDVRPMDGDAYNLHPADASVNITRSNYDFDECSDAGTYISEADAYYTSTSFEPPDAAKGEVARTLFYMAVRYEGGENELDLEVVDEVNTSPQAKHGKLSTLLQWNRDFPPTDLERRRNERVSESQRNRNPFIDNPEFADLIWGDAAVPAVVIGDIAMSEYYPVAGSTIQLSADISGNTTANLYHGTSWDSETNMSAMSSAGGLWSGDLDLSSYSPGDMVYFKIVADDGETTVVSRGSYLLPETKTLTGIPAVQGTGTATPLSGSVVTVGGIITANFDNTYYIQNGNEARNGICVYGIKRGHIGDSVVVTGRATEYNNLTEIDNTTYTYVFKGDYSVEPAVVTIPQAKEDYEGSLVTIKNVTFLEGDTKIPVSEAMTLNFTDGTNSMTVYSRYNSRLGGEIVPAGTVNVTGVVSQYQGTYQLLIHSIDYITQGEDNDAPLVTGVVVNDANWIEVSFNEKIEKSSAENTANYLISDGVVISAAYLYNDTKVLLYVTNLGVQDYTLEVSNVSDLQGNVITTATANFHSDYSSVGLNYFNAQELKIRPNPVRDVLYIDIPQDFNSQRFKLRIIDLSGKLIISREIAATGTLSLLLEDLKAGSYFVGINAGHKTYRGIFIKEN